VALMVTIFLTVYGKEGVRELGEHNLAKASYLASLLADSGKLLFDGAPRFNEFVLNLGDAADTVNAGLLEQKIIGGLALEQWYPELGPGASLWCATEVTKRGDMDAVANALKAMHSRREEVHAKDAEEVLA
jgi:glycine dehydrogenase subunit 1